MGENITVAFRRRRVTTILSGLLASAALFTCPTALAQTSEPAASQAQSGGLEDIVVTARRRAENLQQVPISATALTSAQLASSGISTSNQLAQVTPSLNINGTFETVPKVTLRGVGTNDFLPNMNPAVATNIDEVYVGLATSQLQQLYDIDRVEVLRGPQGTLFGKNATGGAISIFSAKPDLDDYSAAINASYGNYDYFATDGHVNVPLGQDTAVRLSFATRDRDGFVHNLTTGEKNRQQDNWSGRVQLLHESGDLKVLLKLFRAVTNVDVLHRLPIGVIDPDTKGFLIGGVTNAGYRDSGDPYNIRQDADTFDRSREVGASANLEYELGDVTLTSISAYQAVQRTALDDVDGSPYAVANLGYGNKSRFYSQELRLNGKAGNLDWIVGGHFYNERHRYNGDYRFFECTLDNSCTFITGLNPPYPPGNVFPSGPFAGLPVAYGQNLRYVQNNESRAIFGEVNYEITPQLEVTGGLRYTSETRKIASESQSFLLANGASPYPGIPGYPLFQGRKTWTNLSGRAILQYKPSDTTMAYASYSTGFRSGNWNGNAANRIEQLSTPVNPETLTNYEIGVKTELFDRRLRFNLSAFYSKYDDLQVAIFVGTVSQLRNAASAKIYGGEAEITAVPVPGLTARLAAGYTHATYGDFCDRGLAPIDSPRIPFDTACGNDLTGLRLPNAPRLTLAGSLDYGFDVGDHWRVVLGGGVKYQSRFFFTPFNFDHLGTPGYALANFNVRLEKDDDYAVGFFITNAFDKIYKVDGNQLRAPFGLDNVGYGVPRMYGVTVSAKF